MPAPQGHECSRSGTIQRDGRLANRGADGHVHPAQRDDQIDAEGLEKRLLADDAAGDPGGTGPPVRGGVAASGQDRALGWRQHAVKQVFAVPNADAGDPLDP
jgi:hypothetical protein